MKSYLDLTLLPDADLPMHYLMGRVFQQLHLGLVEISDTNGLSPIGVGWPEYGKKLGRQIRLYSPDAATLENFDAHGRLQRLQDYVHLTKVRPVPDSRCEYASFKRVQPKTSAIRLARRRAARKGISLQQALADFMGFEEQTAKTPFLHMTSQSTGRQRFRLFIEQRPAEYLINEGFNTYGLSKGQTSVPMF